MTLFFRTGLMLVMLCLALPLSADTGSALAGVSIASKMRIYKSASCACCQKWVDYMAANGFDNEIIETDMLNPLKAELGIASRYRSCHTGVVSTTRGEYVFEGHVPAQYVRQFLDNPPEGAIGLSVPGMPVGSPGMEVGQRKDYYQVLLLKADGTDVVFAHVNAQE